MKRNNFLEVMRPAYRAVFRLKKDLNVTTYVVSPTSSLFMPGLLHEIDDNIASYIIPKGTELVIANIQSTDKSYSMRPRSPRKIFKGKFATVRWALIPYAAIEYIRDEKVTY